MVKQPSLQKAARPRRLLRGNPRWQLLGLLTVLVVWTLLKGISSIHVTFSWEESEKLSWSAPGVTSTKDSFFYDMGNSSQRHQHQTLPLPPGDNHTDPIRISKEDYVYQFSWGGSPIVLEEYRLLFFTVPKVACSVWKQLFRRMMGYENWRKPNPHDPRTNGLKYLFQYPPHQASAFLNDPSWVRAIFVRDPKSRFLSVYLDKAVGNNGVHLQDKCCQTHHLQASGASLLYNSSQDCWLRGRASLEGFLHLTAHCQDTHWGPQSQRMRGPPKKTNHHRRNEKALWKSINFVGHLETVAADAKALLQRIGAWEDFGAHGWGKDANESIFASTSNVRHATLMANSSSSSSSSAPKRLAEYYTPTLERAVEERFAEDYQHPVLGLVPRPIVYEENG